MRIGKMQKYQRILGAAGRVGAEVQKAPAEPVVFKATETPALLRCDLEGVHDGITDHAGELDDDLAAGGD